MTKVEKPAPERPFAIEFFGLPGVGKTTVAALVTRGLQDRGEAVLNSAVLTRDDLPGARRLFARLTVIARAPLLTARLLPELVSLWQQGQASQRDRLKSIYLYATVSAVLACLERQQQNVIFDQGPAQAAWSMLLRSSGADVAPVIARLRLLTSHRWYVVVLDAPDTTVRQRLDARASKHSRMQVGGAQTDMALWARARRLFNRIVEDQSRAAERGEITLLQLDAREAGPSELAQLVLNDIRRSAQQWS